MRENRVKLACAEGWVSVGSWVNSNDALCAQIMASAGFDWLVVDMEHGPVPISSLQAAVTAIRTTSVEPFARAGWKTSLSIQTALDCGVSGIVVPMVNTRADAEQVVRDARFSPQGERSRGGVRASLSFGVDASTYFAHANDRVLVVAQIETAQAIDNLDDIASVEGIDALFVGPNDLAASYDVDYPAGWAGKTGAYAAAIDLVPKVARAHSKIPGILASSSAMANECIERGYTLVGVSSDTSLLIAASKKVRSEVNALPIP